MKTLIQIFDICVALALLLVWAAWNIFLTILGIWLFFYVVAFIGSGDLERLVLSLLK